MTVDLEIKRKALEELRIADRLLNSALLAARSSHQLARAGTRRSFYTREEVRNEMQIGNMRLLESQRAFDQAMKMLDMKVPAPPLSSSDEIPHWGIPQISFDRTFAPVGVWRRSEFWNSARSLHARITRTFEFVRTSEPALLGTPPLPNWDEDENETIAKRLGHWVRFHKSQVVFVTLLLSLIVIGVYFAEFH